MTRQEQYARMVNRRAEFSERVRQLEQAKAEMRGLHDPVELRRKYKLSRSDYQRFMRQVAV